MIVIRRFLLSSLLAEGDGEDDWRFSFSFLFF